MKSDKNLKAELFQVVFFVYLPISLHQINVLVNVIRFLFHSTHFPSGASEAYEKSQGSSN